MAEPGQLALDPPVSPPRILFCEPQDERLDRCSGGWASGASSRGVVPLPGDEPAMPVEQSTGSDWEDLAPARTMYQPGQRGEPEPVCGLVADRAGQLPAKHGVLVPQHEEFCVLRCLAAEQHGDDFSSGTGPSPLINSPARVGAPPVLHVSRFSGPEFQEVSRRESEGPFDLAGSEAAQGVGQRPGQVEPVATQRGFAHEQLLGDLGVGQSAGTAVQELALALAEQGDAVAPDQNLQYPDDRLRYDGATGGDLEEELLGPAGRQRLGDDPARTRRDARREDETALLLAVDADPVATARQRADRGDALPDVGLLFEVRQVQVEQDDALPPGDGAPIPPRSRPRRRRRDRA